MTFLKQILKNIVVVILQTEARIVLFKYKPKIVAVTGSVGKTTTKDAIYTVLSSAFFVRKSEKSFNSEIGVPLSILGCHNGGNNPVLWIKNIFEGIMLIVFKNHYPKWLVLEVGADTPGDISNIASWLKPDIVVMTRFADIPAHVEFFDSPEAVIKEKKMLAKYMKEDGFLILNNDDKDVLSIKDEYKRKTITYGFEKESNVIGSNSNIIYENKKPTGMTFKVDYGGSSVPIQTEGVLGLQHIYPVLAALAVGASQGLNLVSMSETLHNEHKTQPGRMKLIKGINDSVIIDDSYNSSPIAVDWALKTLEDVESKGRKIAVLGDMMELGKYAIEEHRKIGEKVAGICDTLIVVGLRSKNTAEGALEAGMKDTDILQFEDSKRAGSVLRSIVQEGDIILIKGSRWAMRMERTVEEIMKNPEQADELLVR